MIRMAETTRTTDARLFWDLYFKNRFVELTRGEVEINGKYLHELPPGKSQFSEPMHGSLTIERDELRRYGYQNDGRFSGILRTPQRPHESIQKLVDRSYPFREPPPFGAERMSELFQQMSDQFGWPQDASMNAEYFNRSAQSLASPFKPENSQPLSALLWILGEQRERIYSKIMVQVIEESQHLHSGHKDKMPVSTVNTALEALWKTDDKSRLKPLLKIMDDSNHSGRLKIAALFKRLLSTTHLLSLEALGEKYYSAGYWEGLIRPYSNYSDAQWDRFDTKSLFWEIRHLATKRIVAKDEGLKNVVDDEVTLVRELARSKAV